MNETPQPIALVTGANRGIGLATADRLAEEGYRILAASRDVADGEKAVAPIRERGHAVDVVELSLTEPQQVARVAADLAGSGVKLDLLVNNAAVLLDGFDADVARNTLATNYTATVAFTEAVLPLVRDGGAIIFVSSGMGELTGYSDALRARFLADDLDRAGLDALVAAFIASVERGMSDQDGWRRSAYGVSKAAVNAYVKILARQLASRDITVNAVCPGWVRTRMGGAGASRDVAQGAASVVAPALDPARPTGGFFRDGKAIAW